MAFVVVLDGHDSKKGAEDSVSLPVAVALAGVSRQLLA